MDFIQQCRHTLYFVNNHPTPPAQCFDTLTKRLRLPAQFQKRLGPEKIKPKRVRQKMAEPGGLAGSPRSEQKERPVGQLKLSFYHCHQVYGKSAGGLYTIDLESLRLYVIETK